MRRMENWLEIYRIEEKTQNNFLIGQSRITLTQVYRMKSLFEQMERAVAHINGLLEKSKVNIFRSCLKRRIEEETVHLLFIYETLKEIVRDNEGLQDRFIFDIRRMKRKAEKILGNLRYFSGRFWKSARIDF